MSEQWDKVLKATEHHNIWSVDVHLDQVAGSGRSFTYITCTCGDDAFTDPGEFTDHIRRLVYDALTP